MRYASLTRSDSILLPQLIWIVIIAFAFAGSAMILYGTAVAPWGYSDSAEYIGVTRNMLAGHGFGVINASGEFSPLTLHPPFYSIVLGFLGLFISDLIAAARWLDVFLFAAVIGITGTVTYLITRSGWLAIILSLIMMLSTQMVSAYTGIMSEPLHHTLLISTLLMIGLYFHTGKLWVLVLSAVTGGLTFATRYVGVSVLVAGWMTILLFSRSGIRRRVLDSVVFGVIGILPGAVWLIYNNMKYRDFANRPYDFHVNFWERVGPFRQAVIENIYGWIPGLRWLKLPGGYNLEKYIVSVLILLVIGLLIIVLRKSNRERQNHPQAMTGIRFMGPFAVFTVTYFVIYALAYTYNYPQPDLNERLLYPIFLGGIFTVFIGLWTIAQAWDSSRLIPCISLAVALVFCLVYTRSDAIYLRNMNENGLGYTGLSWKNSETLALIRKLPQDVILVSNEASALHLLLDRRAFGLKELVTYQPVYPYNRYGDSEIDDAERAFREKGAALVLFNSAWSQFRFLYPDQENERLAALVDGLYLYKTANDGSIYFYEKPDWVVEP